MSNMQLGNNKNVTYTASLDLCVSCGICASICPVNAVHMEYAKGQFLPAIDNKCTKCGLCLDICPGIDILPHEFQEKNLIDIQKENCLESYTAYANDLQIRKQSASGGVITTLVTNLVKTGEYDYAFILPFYKFDGKEAKVIPSNNIDDIIAAAKSKYIPVSMYNVIEALKRKDNKRYIIIATGCEISGIKKYTSKFNISEDNLLFLGLFCEKTMNFNILRYFEDTYKKNNEKIAEFYFKTKENGGWPGNVKIVFDSGRQVFVDRRVRMRLKEYFQLNRCLYCVDKLNYYSDIAFGDCYIKTEEDIFGKSSVIIRTQKGSNIIKKYSHLFNLKDVTLEDICTSQRLSEKRKNLKYIEYYYSRFFLEHESKGKNCVKIEKELLKEQKNILLGKMLEFDRINTSLDIFLLRKKGILFVKPILTSIAKYFISTIFLFTSFPGFLIRRKKILPDAKKGDNIIIVGGELFNKGAQAMVFTAVDQLKRISPDKTIYLLSERGDYERSVCEKSMYNFEILPWTLKYKIIMQFPVLSIFLKSTQRMHESKVLKQTIKNTALFIDISGYALSSQWNWFKSVNFLLNVAIAEKYYVDYYILPQSLGPFRYKLRHKIFLFPLFLRYLPYPRKIFAREKEGLNYLKKFKIRNVQYGHDIVLQNKTDYCLSNIYKKSPSLKQAVVDRNSVGIIPNLKIFENTSRRNIIDIYKSLIEILLKCNIKVYLIRHSSDDLQICELIKSYFSENEINIILDDLNPIEFEYIVKQFNFIIASRYHAVVHAYKNSIPSLVIGWATKYYELMENYGQLEYYFDCRKEISREDIQKALKELIANFEQVKIRLSNQLIMSHDKDNIFYALSNNLRKMKK